MNLLTKLLGRLTNQQTTEAFNKIGFHAGPGGNPTGIGTYLYELGLAKRPFFIKSTDAMTGLYDAQEIMKNSAVPHTAVFRRSVRYEGCAPIGNPDVPDYNIDPKTAAINHWQWHKAGLPPELNRDLIWIETINEVRKEPEWGDWLGNFATETAILMNADGCKFAAFGFSSGTPEPESWETPGMLRYLRYCERFPDLAAVALHEYSFKVDDIWFLRGDHIGRFERLFAVCDKHGIARPNVLITEWGWTHNNVPIPETAVKDIKEAAEYYARFPQILGAAIWYLAPGFEGIANSAQKLIEPVTKLTLETTFQVPAAPPPITPPPGSHKAIIVKIPQEVSVEEWNQIAELARPYLHTSTPSHDDLMTLLYGGNADSYAKIAFPERPSQQEAINLVEAAGYRWEPLEGLPTPPQATFSLTHWPTQYKYITQQFAANPQNYDQFGLPGHDGIDIRAPHATKLYAAAPGTVYRVERNSSAHNYGIHVRIEHAQGYKTIYAHMLDTIVNAGDILTGGQLIGRADNTGNSFGNHLHFGMKRPGGDPGWPYDLIDPTPWLRPLAPSLFDPAPPPPPPPPTGKAYDTSFMLADPRAFRVLRRADGSGEDVYDIDLGNGTHVRVKNRTEGEWYIDNGSKRIRDTSPAPALDGTRRLYVQTSNGQPGGQIAPETAVIGQTYTYKSEVQFLSKDNCAPLAENSGTAISTFLLEAVIENYVFPTTGFQVDRLFVTKQTEEYQLYAEVDGRRVGWCGGGAEQDNNNWGAQLAELYWNRFIPQDEPERYCG